MAPGDHPHPAPAHQTVMLGAGAAAFPLISGAARCRQGDANIQPHQHLQGAIFGQQWDNHPPSWQWDSSRETQVGMPRLPSASLGAEPGSAFLEVAPRWGARVTVLPPVPPLRQSHCTSQLHRAGAATSQASTGRQKHLWALAPHKSPIICPAPRSHDKANALLYLSWLFFPTLPLLHGCQQELTYARLSPCQPCCPQPAGGHLHQGPGTAAGDANKALSAPALPGLPVRQAAGSVTQNPALLSSVPAAPGSTQCIPVSPALG